MAHYNTFAIEHIQVNNNAVDITFIPFVNGTQIIRSINIASDDTVNGLNFLLFKCDDNIGTNSFRMFLNDTTPPTTIINNVYVPLTRYSASSNNFILNTPYLGLHTIAATGTKTKLVINYQTFNPLSTLISDGLYQTLYIPPQTASAEYTILIGSPTDSYLIKSIFTTNNTNTNQDGIFSVKFTGGTAPWGTLYSTNTLGALTKELVGLNRILISDGMSLTMTPSADYNYSTMLTYTTVVG
jgi:hypothetical protein